MTGIFILCQNEYRLGLKMYISIIFGSFVQNERGENSK